MGAKPDYLPFAIGSTAGVTASTDLIELEGAEYEVELRDYSQNPAPRYGYLDGARLRLKVVRNVSGIALLPGRVAVFKAGYEGAQIDGYTCTTAQQGYPIDPYLPSAGCPNNDLCYIVIEGPCLIKSPLTGNGDNVWSAGDVLVAITAATSQATTAGRLIAQDLTGATALLAKQVQNRIGAAISAATTAETNTNKMVYVKKW